MPSDSDEELGERLDSALRAALRSDQVDVDALLARSQARAGRLRTRRIALVAAVAVLLVGLPAGFVVFRPTPGAQGPSAALLPSTAASASPGDNSGNSGSGGTTRHPVPDRLALTAAELPPGLTGHGSAPITTVALIDGQTCPPSAAAPARPLSGRRWFWTDPAGPDPTRITVTLTVTHWASGLARPRFGALAAGTGACHWPQPQNAAAFAAPHADQSWSGAPAAGRGADSAVPGRAAVRVGDWIAGVEVSGPGAGQQALSLAQQLAADEARKLAAAR